jgi:hypothetical protein
MASISATAFIFWLAFGLYCVNLVVGAVAQVGWYHFGRAHHGLYFVVFVCAVFVAVMYRHPALLLTLGALAVMPKTRSKHLLQKRWGVLIHPTLALIGLLGYSVVAGTILGWL